MSDENIGKNRNRTISWDRNIDKLAERLAAERGYIKGGVSKLLEELVREEAENPRLDVEDPSPGYAALMRKSQELSDGIRKLREKNKK